MASSPHSHTIPELIYTPPASPTPAQSPSGTANISTREYIYFLPHPLPKNTPVPYTPGLPDTNPLELPSTPFEPTSTLVLTSPGKTFVDLRYLKPINPAESALPNAGERKRLEWGFVGSSQSAPATESPHEKYGAFAHATWTHWLDSRVSVGQPVPVDEGDMFEVGVGLCLEHGHAFHPHLGRVAGHEELWRDVVPETTNEEGIKVCVLLRCHDEGEGVRGVVLRIGRFCQGILQYGAVTTTERWEFDAASEAEEKVAEQVDTPQVLAEERSWKRTVRTGDAFLPCAVTFRTEVVQLGGRIRYGGLEWVVEEVWVWD